MKSRLATVTVLAAALNTVFPASPNAADYAVFNTRVGTQTFAPAYQYEGGTKNKLIETTDRIQELGSDIIKFEMSSRVNSTYGVSVSGIGTLVQQFNSPSYQDVFGRPFQTLIVWMFPFTVNSLNNHWKDGYSSGESANEYAEVYDLVLAMRNSSALAGKTVLLGHWEGDNCLTNGTGGDPGSTAIDGMKAWYRNRQQAVEAAKAATPSSTVRIYHYAEVNTVLQTQWNPSLFTVCKNVLNDPTVTIDLISYSCWDTCTVVPWNDSYMQYSLDHINGLVHFTPAYPGAKKVFIGEQGLPRFHPDGTPWFTEAQQRDQSRALIRKCLTWGCPYVLYWQMYNNGVTGSVQDGLWMIDNTPPMGVKQLVWYDHQDFMGKAHALKNMYRYWLARNPDDTGFQTMAGAYDTFNASTQLNMIVDSSEYSAMLSNVQYVSFLFQKLLNVANAVVDPDYATYLAQLTGGTPRSTVLNNMLNSTRFKNLISDVEFARYLYLGTLRRASVDTGSAEFLATVAQLGTTSRATVWRNFLNSPEFFTRELDLRGLNQIGNETVAAKQFFRLSFPGAASDWSLYK